ncbi:uncharacterized protein MELLADRAFT_63186 [Melampsora larici-populina 98AG31]|uniref:F-box domain-containing protein n=1 Tax=Melampsora larici-populina (strain 98AG31 / pathotype 3-4-7) TaxID=747676 RepID=F4RLR4_MELLP|nr:uncharacterized protein MELLADRAFT_63186 [Melampsora larici-populina 98AG31]EGG06584.1 hypothetical protein MELLADRAFT_63186 [Melampsora larici-populina 98AG31]
MTTPTENQSQLPLEVIQSILHHFIDDCKTTTSDYMNSADPPFLEHAALIQLLQLRLINRLWSNAVIPFAYRSLKLTSALMISNLVGTWKTTLVFANNAHLRGLCFNKMAYVKTSMSGDSNQAIQGSKNSKLDLQDFNVSSTSMSDVAELISLCSTTLSEVKLVFDGPVGFTSRFIDSIKQVDNLTALIITGTPKSDDSDSDSLNNLLNAITPLKSLSLMFPSIPSLRLKTTALPHLKHLCFLYYSSNVEVIRDFCQDQKEKVRFVECAPPPDYVDPSAVILGLQESLEILFMDSIPDGLPRSVYSTIFPRLKIMRCFDCSSMRPDLRWLTLPVVQNLEVFITNYWLSEKYWISQLRSLNSNQFVKPVNWKLLILITYKGDEINLGLVRLFKRFGIRCEFKGELSYEDILVSKYFFEIEVLDYI